MVLIDFGGPAENIFQVTDEWEYTNGKYTNRADIEELNRILDRAVNLKTFLKAKDRVDKVARFVAQHFKENVEPLGYKAFLVGVDREACALYKTSACRTSSSKRNSWA